MNSKEFDRLRAAVRERRDAHSKAVGRRDQLLADLRKEFECDSIEAAEDLLVKLKKDAKAAMEKADAAFREFQAEFDE